MKAIKVLFVTVFVNFISIVVYAEGDANWHFKKTGVGEGLSENSCYCILQDRRGFMWFGTKDGLNRYDGNEIKIYRNDVSAQSSLGNNFIRCMAEGESDRLYLGTDAGLYIMDVSNETFELVDIETAGETSKLPTINSVFRGNNKLWIGTMYHGIFLFDIEKNSTRKIRLNNFDLGNNATWTIYEDRSGTIWIGTRLGLLRYNPDMDFLEPVKELSGSTYNPDYEILSIMECNQGNLWLGTWSGGILCYNRHTMTKKRYLDSSGKDSYYITHVRSIFQYTDNSLFIGSDDGLYLFDNTTQKAKRVDNPKLAHTLSDQNVYSIVRDREGGIWIGTYFGGVNYLNTTLLPIETFHSEMRDGMLFGKAVSQFCEDEQGNLWIATEDGGINHLDRTTKRITQPIKTSYHNTHALLMDGGELWIGTFSRGIDVYNTITGQVTNFRLNVRDTRTLNDDCVYSLYRTRDGEIYVGTPAGLNKYDRSIKSFSRIDEAAGFIYDIKEDEYGNLWIANYNGGVICRNGVTGEWIRYDDATGNDPIAESKLTGIYIDSRKRLIFTSEGRGIFIYDYPADKFRNISEADGLPNNVVYGVLDDHFGNLWLSCNSGIVCFNPSVPNNYRLFTKEDGLQSNQFNYKSSYKASDGKFYFGGINGFNSFYPQDLLSLNSNDNIPPVAITGLSILRRKKGDEYTEVPLNETQKIVLPYYISSFKISYVALSYLSPDRNQYAYRLEGIDREWISAGNIKNVTYINMSPGEYRFRVKASNDSGVWNETGAYLDIKIPPPFWLSLAAKLLYFVLAAALIYLTVYYYWKRNNNKRLRELDAFRIEQENLAYKSKINFFTDIAHEIRTPVSLIVAPLEEVIASGEGTEQTRRNLMMIEKNCNRLNVLITQLLDFRKMDSGKYRLHPERINIKQFMNDLFERFRKTTINDKIEFILNMPDNMDIDIISDSDILTKITGNLLTNAIKFTKNKIILSLIVNTDASYIIMVEDDGYGIPPDQRNLVFDPFYQITTDNERVGSGIGLALVKQLSALLGGEVTIQDNDMGGATFCFIFSTLPDIVHNESGVIEEPRPYEIKTNIEDDEPRQKSILTVDDNPDIISFIKSCLQNDYMVDTVLNAVSAWEHLERNSYDLIISDIMMPDIDGISFTKKIKNNFNYSHIPVILLSAKTENAVKIEGLSSGAEVFIEKPFSPSFLRAQIFSILENRKIILDAFSRSPLTPYSMLATNKGDKKFLSRLNEEIEKNLSDETFSVESLTDILGISRSNLQRKLQAVCNMSPGEYLRNYRLKKASQLLLEGSLRISEVAYYVGFNSASYFSKVFVKTYGILPKEFIRKKSL